MLRDKLGTCRFESRSRKVCFLDSDHLQHLDALLNVVRCNTHTLVVFLTAVTLRRPWCAAEIAATNLSHRRAAVIYTPTFQRPTAEELHIDNVELFSHPSDLKFAEHGVSFGSIAAGLAWLLSDEVPHFTMEPLGSQRSCFEVVVSEIVTFGRPGTFGSADSTTGPLLADALQPDLLLLSVHLESYEACAAAGILTMTLQKNVWAVAPSGMAVLPQLPAGQIHDAVARARAMLVVLSQGSLKCTLQRQVLRAVFAARLSPSEATPATLPDFKFTDVAAFNSLADGALDTEPVEAVKNFS